jgi:hypothetical protein
VIALQSPNAAKDMTGNPGGPSRAKHSAPERHEPRPSAAASDTASDMLHIASGAGKINRLRWKKRSHPPRRIEARAGERLNRMHAWLDDNCGWLVDHVGGVGNDAIAIYLREAAFGAAFESTGYQARAPVGDVE